jgi:hypothetical protein
VFVDPPKQRKKLAERSAVEDIIMGAERKSSQRNSSDAKRKLAADPEIHGAEYTQANENLRFSFTMELGYFRFHTNSIVLLLVAYWFTAELAVLRIFLSVIGIIISVSGIVVEFRTIRYYRNFFDAIVSLENAHNLTQMSFLTKHVTAPRLNIRTSHMIYVLFALALAFWIVILAADVLQLSWFTDMLTHLRDVKRHLP